MSYNFLTHLTLLLTFFLRDHNVSLRATDVGEDLTQILRICIFTHENHAPKGNAYPKAPFTPKFHMTTPLLNSSWEVSCGAHVLL